MPDWRVIPAECGVAECEGCKKEALSQRIIVWEELQAKLHLHFL
jgi:hypothetical protein